MTSVDNRLLAGRRVLVVEDEYLLADDLCRSLKAAGAEVVGPAPSVDRALGLLEAGPAPDLAVLDVNLGGEPVLPVAEALAARGVRFALATGYDAWALPETLIDVPRCEKPVDARRLIEVLLGREAAA